MQREHDMDMDKTRTKLLLERHGQRTTLFSEVELKSFSGSTFKS
jgi:hypothetical protein